MMENSKAASKPLEYSKSRQKPHENLYYCLSEDYLPPPNQSVQKIKPELPNSKLSFSKFTQNTLIPTITFIGDKNNEIYFTEPKWDPLKDFESEMSIIPQDVLNSWQKQHVEEFVSAFGQENDIISMLNLDEAELNKTQSEIIRHYCRSIVRMMTIHFDFLKEKFPNIMYAPLLGCLPEEIPGHPPPPLDHKVIVLTIAHLEKSQTYPAVVIVPTGYSMHSKDYKLLKDSLKKIGNRWKYEEFYGILTNFKMTVFIKYNRDEEKYYRWEHIVNFNECFLKNQSPKKLENFYRIWFALLYRAMQVYSIHISS